MFNVFKKKNKGITLGEIPYNPNRELSNAELSIAIENILAELRNKNTNDISEMLKNHLVILLYSQKCRSRVFVYSGSDIPDFTAGGK